MIIRNGGVYREVNEQDIQSWLRHGWELVEEEVQEKPKKKK